MSKETKSGTVSARMSARLAKVVVGGASLCAVAAFAAVAQANTYSDVSAGGLTFSNIQDVVTVNGNTSTTQGYGQPVAVVTSNGVYLEFNAPNIIADSTDGQSVSTVSRIFFDVSVNTAVSSPINSVSENEFGGTSDFPVNNSDQETVSGELFVNPQSNPTLIGRSNLGFTPNPPYGTSIGWTGGTTLGLLSPSSGVHVALNNDLAAISGNPGIASIDKKGVVFYFPGTGGTPPIPEPATLGLLGIGALGLIGRRRQRA